MYLPCPLCSEPSEAEGDQHMACLGCGHTWQTGANPPPIEGDIDTTQKLIGVLGLLTSGSMAVSLQPELPPLPEDSLWHDKVIFMKVVGAHATRADPFWVIALAEDQEQALSTVHKMIEKMGCAVTGEGFIQ